MPSAGAQDHDIVGLKISSQVKAVDRLDNHLLAGGSTVSPRQLEALAAVVCSVQDGEAI